VLSYCNGEVIVTCEPTGYPEFGAQAVFVEPPEYCLDIEQNGIWHAEYVLSKEPCPLNAQSWCVENTLAQCGSSGYPTARVLPLVLCAYDDDCTNVEIDGVINGYCSPPE
jgi:hypothetical protein